jgi:hypothetical protein
MGAAAAAAAAANWNFSICEVFFVIGKIVIIFLTILCNKAM